MVGATLISETNTSAVTTVAVVSSVLPPKELAPGATTTLYAIHAVHTSLNGTSGAPAVLAAAAASHAAGSAAAAGLLAEHTAAWAVRHPKSTC